MEKEENQQTRTEKEKSEENKNTESTKNLETENLETEKQQPENENIEEKELSLEEKILQLEDKLARSFAEMENQRRRFEKEKEDAFEYGGFAFAKEALSIIDNLERSKQVLENDEDLKNSDALNKSLEHLEIIKKDLISIFSKNNIKPINCLDKKLDPNFHQAMIEIENEEKDPGTIVQEIQKGFTIKDRLLRPSLVAVSKKKPIKMKKTNKIMIINGVNNVQTSL